MNVVFLDFDGTMNRYGPGLLVEQDCMQALNRVLDETSAKVVVSSSWRQMVFDGEMTIAGLSYLLRTHGLRSTVIGVTPEESDRLPARHKQITAWLIEYRKIWGIERHVVLDDDATAGEGHPFVQTDCTQGLTERDADKAIRLLTR